MSSHTALGSPTTTWPTRLPILVLSLVVCVFTLGTVPPFAATVPMALLLVVACVATRAMGEETGLVVPAALVVAALSVMAPFQFVVMALKGLPVIVPAVLVCLGAASVVLAALRPRWFPVHLLFQGSVLLMMLENIHPKGDVRILVEQSVASLAAGRNPYGLTFLNPYSAAETPLYWAPEFVTGDRINVGFPYLPGALLGDLPGHLLGDVRYASAAAVLLATVLAWRLTSEVVGRAMVAALPTSLLSMTTVLGYWVEPLVVAGVALLVWGMAANRRATGAVGLVLLLTVKQYAVVMLPLELFVRRRLGVRTLAAGVVGAAIIVGIFFLWGPRDFWRSVVLVYFSQPLRPDSVSLSVDLVGSGVPVPFWAMGVSSVVAGVAVAWWVRMSALPSPTWTALGAGLSLLASVLLSKAGHVNYYFVVYGCLVIGLASWPRDLGSSSGGTGDGDGQALLVEGDQREA